MSATEKWRRSSLNEAAVRGLTFEKYSLDAGDHFCRAHRWLPTARRPVHRLERDGIHSRGQMQPVQAAIL